MKNLFLLTLTFLFISACKETELEKSIYIPDSDYPGLPAYTEWGYNTFGAFVDREVFVSNDIKIPFKVIHTGGKTSFIFYGERNYYNLNLTFKIAGFQPSSASGLIALNDSIFDLNAGNIQIEMDDMGVIKECIILNGMLHFKRAQNLLVDGNPTEVILSGVFEFQALIDSIPTTFSDGRFDVGVGRDNFYSY